MEKENKLWEIISPDRFRKLANLTMLSLVHDELKSFADALEKMQKQESEMDAKAKEEAATNFKMAELPSGTSRMVIQDVPTVERVEKEPKTESTLAKQYLHNVVQLYKKIGDDGGHHFNAYDIENWFVEFEKVIRAEQLPETFTREEMVELADWIDKNRWLKAKDKWFSITNNDAPMLSTPELVLEYLKEIQKP